MVVDTLAEGRGGGGGGGGGQDEQTGDFLSTPVNLGTGRFGSGGAVGSGGGV